MLNFILKSALKPLVRYLPDWLAISLLYRRNTGHFPNLIHPRTFNEKLQWLKLHDRNPLYTQLADKYAAKNVVAQMIGDKYIIPTLGVWDRFDDIDFNNLPAKFVLKTTHDSAGVVLIRDKFNFDFEGAKKKINSSLKRNFYYVAREWPYKNIKPRIIAEKFMEEERPVDGNINKELIDYKFYCFQGEPKFLYVSVANFHGLEKQDLLTYLNLDWTPTPFTRPDHPQMPFWVEKPKKLDEMISIAKKLSNNIPFVRVDLYYINERVYFSELTFTPGRGVGIFTPIEWEYRIGQWITIV